MTIICHSEVCVLLIDLVESKVFVVNTDSKMRRAEIYQTSLVGFVDVQQVEDRQKNVCTCPLCASK